MKFDDFIQNFVVLNVCKVGNWHELRVKGEFVKGLGGGAADENTVRSRYIYEIEVMRRQKVHISIH